MKIEIFTKQLTKERLCQFWLNTFFIAQRTKTGEDEDCAIFGEEKQYIVSLSKPETDKINKDKKHKIVPRDFKIEMYFEECSNKPHHSASTSEHDISQDSDPETDTDLDSDDENGAEHERGEPTPV